MKKVIYIYIYKNVTFFTYTFDQLYIFEMKKVS